MKQISVRLPDDVAAFLERKREQVKRQVATGKEDGVSMSKVVEALLVFWRALDMDEDTENQHKNHGQGNEEKEEDEPETEG